MGRTLPYFMNFVLQFHWERLIPPWTHTLHQAPSLIFLNCCYWERSGQCVQSTRKTHASCGCGGWCFELYGYHLKSILFYLVTPDCLCFQLGHFKSRCIIYPSLCEHFIVCLFSGISFTNCKLVLY